MALFRFAITLPMLYNVVQKYITTVFVHFSTTVRSLAGGFWSTSLRFYEYHPDGSHTYRKYDEETIRTQLLPLFDSSDSVESLTVYKSNDVFYTTTLPYLYHTFLVAKTANWYYSLEKANIGLIIQRSRLRENVLHRIKSKTRQGVEPLAEGRRLRFSGQLPFGRIIEWIQVNGELGKGFSFLGNNCQHFVDHFKDAFVL